MSFKKKIQTLKNKIHDSRYIDFIWDEWLGKETEQIFECEYDTLFTENLPIFPESYLEDCCNLLRHQLENNKVEDLNDLQQFTIVLLCHYMDKYQFLNYDITFKAANLYLLFAMCVEKELHPEHFCMTQKVINTMEQQIMHLKSDSRAITFITDLQLFIKLKKLPKDLIFSVIDALVEITLKTTNVYKKYKEINSELT